MIVSAETVVYVQPRFPRLAEGSEAKQVEDQEIDLQQSRGTQGRLDSLT